MIKTLRYFFVAIMAMVVGNSYAGTITFEELNLENGTQYLDPFDGGDFTVTFAGGTNDGKYYTTGSGIRVYGNGTMTIAAKSGTLTSIVVTYDGTNKPTDATVVDGGTYDPETGTWTGDAASVVFTRPSGSGHWRVKKIEVTVNAGETSVAVPVISGTTPFAGSAKVTITAEEGANIYYTLDGTEPTVSSTKYTEEITLTATTTVTAIAEKGGNVSAPASKTFTALATASNITELNALADKTPFLFTGKATVVFASGSYVYIKDETGSSLIYKAGLGLAKGDVVKENWQGTVSIYNRLFEAVPTTTLEKDGTAEVSYPEATIADVKADNMNQVVTLKGVTYTKGSGKNLTIASGETTVAGYNQFGLTIADPEDGATYDIEGVISVYNANVQFQPVTITKTTTVGISSVKAADAASGAVYNAAGQQVGAGYKGLVIKNGRKYIVK